MNELSSSVQDGDICMETTYCMNMTKSHVAMGVFVDDGNLRLISTRALPEEPTSARVPEQYSVVTISLILITSVLAKI